MSKNGWISLHRSIQDHWLFDEERKFSKFEAWIDLLLMVNHTDKKLMLGNELITIKRGQKVTSIRKLCERWNWSNNKVKNFLNVLETDGMLIVKSDSKKTLVTVVNYDVYQNENLEKRHQSDTKASDKNHQSDTKASQKHTNNNVNNDNNVVVERNTSNDFGEVFGMYQREIQHTPSPTVIDKLSDDFDYFGKEVMEYAIKKSAINGNRDYRFIDYLTKQWRKEQLNSIEAIEQYEDKRIQSNHYNNNGYGSSNTGGRPDLSFQALELKKGKTGLASFTDEERKAYEKFYT